jgi:Capsular polysaccharide biosynthesis protein
MFGLFNKRRSFQESGLLQGAVDQHSHILYGLDDGVKRQEDSLAILRYLEEQGVSDVWFTPHVMEDVANTTEGIRARFGELKAVYTGGLRLHLAAEYMMDTLFEERLAQRDLLLHGNDTVLVETSAVAPPINFWEMLETMLKAGYRPLIAHPERYHYMEEDDYKRLHAMGCLLQMNLPSIVGFYGEYARSRALRLLDLGLYSMVGTDCHRFRAIRSQFEARELKKDTIGKLARLMGGPVEI